MRIKLNKYRWIYYSCYFVLIITSLLISEKYNKIYSDFSTLSSRVNSIKQVSHDDSSRTLCAYCDSVSDFIRRHPVSHTMDRDKYCTNSQNTCLTELWVNFEHETLMINKTYSDRNLLIRKIGLSVLVVFFLLALFFSKKSKRPIKENEQER